MNGIQGFSLATLLLAVFIGGAYWGFLKLRDRFIDHAKLGVPYRLGKYVFKVEVREVE